MGNHFREGKVGRLDVEIAFDNLEVGRDGAEVLVRQRGSQVSQTKDLADFAGGEEFLELREGEKKGGGLVGSVISRGDEEGQNGANLCGNVLNLISSLFVFEEPR